MSAEKPAIQLVWLCWRPIKRASDKIRVRGLCLRRAAFYSAELRARVARVDYPGAARQPANGRPRQTTSAGGQVTASRAPVGAPPPSLRPRK